MLLLADGMEINWSTVGVSVGAAVAPILGALGYAVKWLFDRFNEMGQKQREHEEKMANKYETVSIRVETIATGFEETAKNIAKESRIEAKETVHTLLGIQREAVQTMGGVSTRVAELAQSINELKETVREMKAKPHDDHTAG